MEDLGLSGTVLDRSRPMRDQIYAILRQLILTSRIAPGAALDEKAIAADLAVSRTPVHEAVQRLSDERLVEVRAQSGTFVARIDRGQIEEAQVIRRALESESAAQAAARMADAAAERLEDILMLHEAALDRRRYPDAIAHDDAFHRAICEIAGYPALWRAIDVSKAPLDRCRHMMIPREGMAAATIADHRAILACLRQRDPEGARAAMRGHLDRAYGQTLAFLDALQAGE